MRLAIEATLNYEFSGPTDVLMAVEAAAMGGSALLLFGLATGGIAGTALLPRPDARAEDGRGIAVRSGTGLTAAFDEIRRRYRADREFKQTVDRYIAEFERLLEEVSRDDRGQVVVRTYLTSETGKVYTMLAHAAGRFDQ